MFNSAIIEEITRAAEELDSIQQQRVLAYIHSMKARPPGAKPDSLLKMAGAIPGCDCDEIQKAIDEGCGQVNINAW